MSRRDRSWWVAPATLGGAAATLLGTLLVTSVAAVLAAAPAVPHPDLRGAEDAVRAKIEHYRREVAAHLDDGKLWGRYAMVLEAHGFIEQAKDAYREAVTRDPGELRWPYYLAAALDASDPEDAVSWYRKALALDPGYAPLRVRLARTLETLGRDEEAKEQYLAAARLDSANSIAPLGLGGIALRRGDLEEARSKLERSYQLNPQVHATVTALARVYHRLGDAARAQKLLNESQDLPRILYLPDQLRADINHEAVDRRSFLRRSRTFREVGKPDEARFELERLLELDPEYAEGHLAAADLYAQLGDFEVSARAARRALELDPELIQARARLAMALFELGRHDEAEQQATRVLGEDPGDARLQVLVAMVYANRGRDDLAVAALERAVASRPTDTATGRVLSRLLTELAAAYADLGRFDDALRVQEQGLEVAKATRLEPSLIEQLRVVVERYRQRARR